MIQECCAGNKSCVVFPSVVGGGWRSEGQNSGLWQWGRLLCWGVFYAGWSSMLGASSMLGGSSTTEMYIHTIYPTPCNQEGRGPLGPQIVPSASSSFASVFSFSLCSPGLVGFCLFILPEFKVKRRAYAMFWPHCALLSYSVCTWSLVEAGPTQSVPAFAWSLVH